LWWQHTTHSDEHQFLGQRQTRTCIDLSQGLDSKPDNRNLHSKPLTNKQNPARFGAAGFFVSIYYTDTYNSGHRFASLTFERTSLMENGLGHLLAAIVIGVVLAIIILVFGRVPQTTTHTPPPPPIIGTGGGKGG